MQENDTPRRFSIEQRRSLFSAAGGKCEICSVDLEPGWHADHAEAWSNGGATDVANGQALCATCNLKKGNRKVIKFDNLRPWQKRFVRDFRAHMEDTFLLVALPGGGKTIAALYAAQGWVNDAGDRPRLILVVAPSKHLRGQWKKAAKRAFGMEFQTKEFDGSLKHGMHGVVMTYSAIASSPDTYRRLCAKYEVFVIFDEVHHVGEEASWGIAVQQAFELAAKRLAMSGTPWRSDGGSSIPFLRKDHETGRYIHNHVFDWPLALEEEPRAIRHLVFRPYDGYSEHEQDGKVFRLHTNSDMSDDDAARCLRGVVNEQLFAMDMMRDAHEKLLDLRKSKDDAAGLVVCVDINHAQRVAGWLEEITGERVSLIVSDEEISQGECVDSFEAQKRKWIVSVRQVSEGVDVPRLMVGVYLTNYATELFFRQFVGRVARHQQTEFDLEAYIYLPNDRRLVSFAEQIKKLQALAIKNRETKERDATQPGAGTGPVSGSIIYLGGSHAEQAGVIIPGLEVYGPTSERQISTFARRYGITETAAAQILRDQGHEFGEPELSGETSEEPLEDRLERERGKNEKAVRRWALTAKIDFKDCHRAANTHAGCESVSTATLDQLIRRHAFVQRKIEEVRHAARP